MKILKSLIAAVMAASSPIGIAKSDYKYEKPAGADSFYHAYKSSIKISKQNY